MFCCLFEVSTVVSKGFRIPNFVVAMSFVSIVVNITPASGEGDLVKKCTVCGQVLKHSNKFPTCGHCYRAAWAAWADSSENTKNHGNCQAKETTEGTE